MDLERAVGRLISAGTYLSVAVLAVGVGLMTASGRSPLAADVVPFDPARLAGELAAGQAEGWLWLGLGVAIATPAARVAAALLGYLSRGERTLAVIAAIILGIVATAIVVALVGA